MNFYQLGTLLRIEWLRLWRGGTAPVLLVVLVATSAFAAFLGGRNFRKEAQVVQRVRQIDSLHLDSLQRWVVLPATDTSGLREKAKSIGRGGHHDFYVTSMPHKLSAWVRGVRDFYPNYYKLRPNSLFKQMEVGEITNPSHLSVGPFDLALVLVLLLPLLAIALFYDIYSRENEGGTLALARVQAGGIIATILPRIFVRVAFLLFALFASLFISGVVASVGWPAGATSFALLAAAYGIVWVILVLGLCTLRLNGAATALLAFGLWQQ